MGVKTDPVVTERMIFEEPTFHFQKLAVGKHSMEGEATSWNAIFSKKKTSFAEIATATLQNLCSGATM